MTNRMSRRDFLKFTGAAGGMLIIGGYVVAELADPQRAVFDRLAGNPLTDLPQDAGAWVFEDGELTLDLARLPELESLGGAVRIEGDLLPDDVLVFLGEDEAYYAFKNACTHAGRKIDPVTGEMVLECCSVNGSRYGYDGAVLSGPAEAPLTAYPAALEGSVLHIILRDA
jgi:nitrite reductase/ring-hydroxylating ferredoxin subunit